MTKPYRVLLYYKYVHIDDPETFTAEHLAFCKELGVKGRILISDEGINGTLSGTVEQTDRYMNALRDDPRFHDIFFKIDKADEHAFKKIFVRYRKEIVTFLKGFSKTYNSSSSDDHCCSTICLASFKARL